MCSWAPDAASPSAYGFLPASFGAAPQSSSNDDGPRDIALDRPPTRVIKDPYPTFSAVAVDMKNNEIILQDENLFQIMSYDGDTNTPPTAALSEPKRVIGGHHTKIEFNCGLYVDPESGDIYSVNNDTIDTLVIFSREVRGDMPPTRELRTPHRTYGIDVNEATDELFMTIQDPPYIIFYDKQAKDNDQPKRIIRGNKTELADAHGLSLDSKNGWIFVANYGNAASYREQAASGRQASDGGGGSRIPGSGRFVPPSITIYPIDGEGDIAPLRKIEGPRTQFNWPAHIFVDEEHGDLYVANDGGDSILVFKVTDNGDVAPTRFIKGPRTQIKNPTGISVDTKNDEIVVANMGNHRATVFPRTANGDVPPKRVIRSAPADQPALQIGNPGAVAYDTKRDEILVPN